MRLLGTRARTLEARLEYHEDEGSQGRKQRDSAPQLPGARQALVRPQSIAPCSAPACARARSWTWRGATRNTKTSPDTPNSTKDQRIQGVRRIGSPPMSAATKPLTMIKTTPGMVKR